MTLPGSALDVVVRNSRSIPLLAYSVQRDEPDSVDGRVTTNACEKARLVLYGECDEADRTGLVRVSGAAFTALARADPDRRGDVPADLDGDRE